MSDRFSERDITEFNRGYLIACRNIANLHNEECIAADVLMEAGITQAEVDAMDLSEYDAEALVEIRAARNDDPIEKISKPKRKKHDVLSASQSGNLA